MSTTVPEYGTPEPLHVDTSIKSTSDHAGLLAAPDFSFQLPMPSFEEFNSMRQGSAGGGFSAALNGSQASGARAGIAKYAEQFLGKMYKWGGSNPNSSFDCSGFTQYVLKKFGVNLPRVSYQQANFGTRVGLNQLKAGDLVAWDNSSRNNGADHIALYIGDGQIMEFYRSGKPSRIRHVSDNEGAWGVSLDKYFQ